MIKELNIVLGKTSGVSDLCITRAGANTFYECLYMNTPVLIDGTKGFLYQEEGVKRFLTYMKVGEFFMDSDDLEKKLEWILDEVNLIQYKNNVKMLQLDNGSQNILKAIFV